MNVFRFYAGTHASSGQPSIYRCEADFDNLTFNTLYTMEGISDPTYLAGPAGGVLYALGKSPEGGLIYALKDDDEDLTILSKISSGGKGPCHISVDSRREFLLCANYGSGSVALFDLEPDGSIRSMCDHRQYEGTGFDSEDRQKGPHAHYAAFHPTRDYVYVCDLGLDSVYVYKLDRGNRKLRSTYRNIKLPDGSGPRHLAINRKNPKMLYVLTEMANQIFVYRYDEYSGRYQQIQFINACQSADEDGDGHDKACGCRMGGNGIWLPREDLMLPSTADNGSIGCAIRFSSDNEYLFVSSRLGYQSISAFSCSFDGHLRVCSRCLCGGITPRDFNVLAGRGNFYYPVEHRDFLLVANQDSDLITALQFDRRTERLSLLDMKMQAVKPTCILPYKVPF